MLNVDLDAVTAANRMTKVKSIGDKRISSLIITTIIIVITRDVALLEDPIYLNYVQLFASSMEEFDQAFASAW